MKSFSPFLLTVATPLLAAALVLLPNPARADAKGAATRQLSLSRSQLATTTVAAKSATTHVAMFCSQCTDSQTEVSESTFKAAHPVVKHVVSTHDCSACATKMVSAGHGKMATVKAVHTCDMETKGCCATD